MRPQVLVVAISLPFWMLLRSLVRAVGSVMPALARALARALPVQKKIVTPFPLRNLTVSADRRRTQTVTRSFFKKTIAVSLKARFLVCVLVDPR